MFSPSQNPLVLDDPISNLPVLFLWPHSSCNCRCVMCDIWKVPARREISVEEITRWADEWQSLGIRHVILTGGEPLMHSQFWALCEALKHAGMVITLLSTGISLFNVAERVINYCSGVRFSLDGPPSIHNQIRQIPLAFSKLQKSVAALRAHSKTFPIFGRSAVHKLNCRNLCETVETAHVLGFDRISFLATDVSSDAFARTYGWQKSEVEDLILSASDIEETARQIDKLERDHARDFETGFINESPDELRQKILVYYTALLNGGHFAPNTCNAPWISCVVEYDGTVRPCFFQPPYGNLRETNSLNSLLNSPKAVSFRRSLDVLTNDICRKCVCTFKVTRCQCKWSRNPPFCDNTCLLADLLGWAEEEMPAAQATSN